MIVTDANIWIDHLRARDEHFARLLWRREILLHPFTIGEIALGSLPNRAALLDDLGLVPPPPMATDDEVVLLIEAERLWGTGIGYVDCHLIASTRLVANGSLWTRDKRLHAQAERLGLAYAP